MTMFDGRPVQYAAGCVFRAVAGATSPLSFHTDLLYGRTYLKRDALDPGA
ncbi:MULTISPECIES: hypothetical protein [Roseovarius]|nr:MULTISPECIES: hypothetical protein [Roseovarius]